MTRRNFWSARRKAFFSDFGCDATGERASDQGQTERRGKRGAMAGRASKQASDQASETRLSSEQGEQRTDEQIAVVSVTGLPLPPPLPG